LSKASRKKRGEMIDARKESDIKSYKTKIIDMKAPKACNTSM
jgi:hypothetical protein